MNSKLKKTMVKTILIVAAIVLVIMFINSASFLRWQLTLGTWDWIDNGRQWDDNMMFDPSGEVLSESGSHVWDWELLKNKVLVFDGKSYRYGYDEGEWYFNGSEICISDTYKFTRFGFLYPES